jgi:hypothetical protein
MRATEITSSPYDKVNDYFGDILPARWGDGQTSDQSWEHVWEEAEIQLLLIADSFQTEVKRICKENPDFRYPAYPR